MITFEPLVKAPLVAEHLGLKVRQFYRLKAEGKIPSIRLSRKCVRYRISDVDKALEKFTIKALQDCIKK